MDNVIINYSIIYIRMNSNTNSLELTPNEYQLYARHLILPEIQIAGQQRLKKAKIIFIGAGGLASASLLYLVASGVGNIGIVDNDTIEMSNLQRQILFNSEQIGNLKSICAKKNLSLLNPYCKINIYSKQLNLSNTYRLIQQYDMVIDGTDNFETRYIISHTCKVLHKVHIYGAIFEFQGQASVFNYRGGPTYADVYPLISTRSVTQCNQGGVLGVTPGMIGMIQATEAIKIITGIGEVLSGTLLIYDSLTMMFKKIQVKTNNQYNLNHLCKKTKNHVNADQINRRKLSITLLLILLEKYSYTIYVIDIRNKIEYDILHLKGAINLPLNKLKRNKNLNLLKNVSRYKYIIIFCFSKIRSRVASDLLFINDIKHWEVYDN
uniref:Probable molybdopterin-synthase adenylyltransferase n=1 Tax=Balbiania investiens TaxID=111861 RepID=A0A4D6BMZ4_9FLOR|nr:Molybdopterin biosynthesis protein [Balbiania investiens]QBX88578.1 Molybdopterin biosynthesis protein [Balbiania investiens]